MDPSSWPYAYNRLQTAAGQQSHELQHVAYSAGTPHLLLHHQLRQAQVPQRQKVAQVNFSGPVGTYTSLSDGSRSNKLISSAAIMFHLLFLVLSSMCILPLLPDNLDIKDIREKNEIGYFPFALIPVLISGYKDGEYFVMVIYLAIALSGFNLILGVSTNIVSICALSYSRSRLVF